MDQAYWKHQIKIEQEQEILQNERREQEAQYEGKCRDWAAQQLQLGKEWRTLQFNSPHLHNERVRTAKLEKDRQDREAEQALREAELEKQRQAEALQLKLQEEERQRKEEEDRLQRETWYDSNQW